MISCFQSRYLFLSTLFILSCQSHSTVKPGPVLNQPLLIGDMNCEQLIEKSNEADYALKGLAGLKAHKNCKNFKYNFKLLSDLERKIYSEEIDELDLTKPAAASSQTIQELQTSLKKAEFAEDRFKFYKLLRSKQKSQGQRNDFLKTTAEMFNWTKSDWKKNKKNTESQSRFYEATLLMARTYWTENKMTQAEKILNETLRLLKDTTSLAEIYFLKARMADENLLHDDVITQFDLALEDIKIYKPKNLSFSLDKILWLKSWSLYKNKKYDQAQKSFAELYASTTENNEKSKALFYQARCLQQLDKKDEAKKALETITKDDFFSFYGLVAYHELGLKFPALSELKVQKKFIFDLDLQFLSEIEKKLFKELILNKEINIAERSVAILAQSINQQVNLGLYLAEHGKRYLPLFAAFSKLDNNDKIEGILNYGHLLFPQPYLENVKAMSEKTQIPVSLIYSIMKQESAFNEKTRSHADAFGLMQVIPRLAKHLSKKFEIPYEKPDDLFDPEINIQMGTYELHQQIRKQSGQLAYVAAAYNAGPNALSNWLKTKKHNDVIEFIEDIPYEETRTYVKIITRNKLFYERISKRDEQHPFPIEFITQPSPE